MALSIGASNFSMEGSDSPSLARRFVAARPNSVNTCSLYDPASRCSRAMDSPVAQLAAFSATT